MSRYRGEPSLNELLDDPIVDLIMRADGCDRAQLETIIDGATAQAPAKRERERKAAVKKR